jgi:MinD-like ATPase involved in chromosome partitioning or flagellar assembly
VALALRAAQRRTLFAELGGLGPTAAWLLKVQPVQTLLELASGDGFRLAKPALQTCIVVHRSGMHYLAVHRPAAPLAKLPAGILADALHLVENDYDAIIVDCGVSALGINNEALLHAGAVLPVAEHDSACFWHLGVLLDWVRANKLEGKVPGFVLVDRSPSATEDIPAMVARQVRLGIVGIIPPATDVLYHVNSLQEPLYLADPDCATSSALSELAWRVMNQPIEIPPSFRP